MQNSHDKFQEQSMLALKVAGQTLIDNAEAIIGKVNDDLGRASTVITITLPSANDGSDAPEIEVSSIFISRKVVETLYGSEL